jgi:hypothetical protein
MWEGGVERRPNQTMASWLAGHDAVLPRTDTQKFARG